MCLCGWFLIPSNGFLAYCWVLGVWVVIYGRVGCFGVCSVGVTLVIVVFFGGWFLCLQFRRFWV